MRLEYSFKTAQVARRAQGLIPVIMDFVFVAQATGSVELREVGVCVT